MGWLSYFIFYLGFALQILLLGRCLKVRIWKHYPFFLAYVASTVVSSISVLAILVLKSHAYAALSWTNYFVSTVFRFAVAWEIFRQAFPPKSPIRRIAGSILGITLCILAIQFYTGAAPKSLIADLVRKLSLAMVVWMVATLALARYYCRPLGRNVRGIAFGILTYVSFQLACFSAGELFPGIRPVWPYLNPLAFIYLMVVWLFSVWDYEPAEAPAMLGEMDRGRAIVQWARLTEAIDAALRKALRQ